MTTKRVDYSCGIEFGDYDNLIKSSSDYGEGLVKGSCKLNCPNCWLAADNDKDGYIEVELKKDHRYLSAISVQGRFDQPSSDQYTKKFRILRSTDGIEFNNWMICDGNINCKEIKKIQFPEIVYCKAIRIQPLECNNYRCLKFELYYSIPKKQKVNEN